MTAKSIQNEANLAQAVGKEYSKISENMKKSKNASANTKMIKTSFVVLMCGDFCKTRRVQLLGVYGCFMKTRDKNVV